MSWKKSTTSNIFKNLKIKFLVKNNTTIFYDNTELLAINN